VSAPELVAEKGDRLLWRVHNADFAVREGRRPGLSPSLPPRGSRRRGSDGTGVERAHVRREHRTVVAQRFAEAAAPRRAPRLVGAPRGSTATTVRRSSGHGEMGDVAAIRVIPAHPERPGWGLTENCGNSNDVPDSPRPGLSLFASGRYLHLATAESRTGGPLRAGSR
jgi:hypothetical protein